MRNQDFWGIILTIDGLLSLSEIGDPQLKN